MFMSSAQPPKSDRFIDSTGEHMTSHDLKLASWLARHRVFVRRVSIIIAGIIAGGFFLYGVGGLIGYAIFGMTTDNRQAEELVQSTANYAKLQARYRANELRIVNADVYEASANRYDFVATVANDNTRWAAIVSYKFTYGGGETDVMTTTILPSTERPFVIPGFKVDAGFPNTVSFVIDSIEWRRIDTHAIADIEGYMAERKKFVIEDMVFTSQSDISNVPSNILRFTLVNNSSFSYWDVPLIVELFQNGTRVGIAQTKVEKIKAGERRPIDLRTLTSNIAVTDIQVHPIVNIFDNRVYMAPEAN